MLQATCKTLTEHNSIMNTGRKVDAPAARTNDVCSNESSLSPGAGKFLQFILSDKLLIQQLEKETW